ncbi:unnamed protein product [Somion occarium]|uniref:Peptidase S9 prolyl oligopeptidase catalytic domain-containing protein n=1 Tax=Somion occarium TaxID=3059160 RepID=A0ABP1D4B0_9APHY
MPKVAPFGTWQSPITVDSLVESSVKVDNVIVDPITSTVYHVEKRPSEGGRSVLVRTEESVDVIGKEFNCRTGVHEYGGAAATVCDGVIYFSNFSDGRVYKLKEGDKPEPITPESSVYRFADFAVYPRQTRLLIAILEDHTKPDPADVVNTLCVIDTESRTISPLVSGADFYAAPTFSPNGSHFAWQQWSHPDMPWDGAEIHVATVLFKENGAGLALTGITHVAGKPLAISAADPIWISNETLLYTSDESGYQNPYVHSVSSAKSSPVLSNPITEDFSLPAWALGVRYGAALDKAGNKVLFTALRDGRSHLYVLTLHCNVLEEISCPYVSISNVIRVADDNVVFVGAKINEPAQIVLCSLRDYSLPHYSALNSISSTSKVSLPAGLISKPQPMALLVPPNNDPLHVVCYPPTNPEYVGPEGEQPPCVVHVHGGPTGFQDQSLNMTTQFFTSRGWAWLNVNYGGSSGYGRKYIDRLYGQWGVVDVRDCALAASTLSKPPYSLIDPARTAIRGGSAGGFTVLATLCAYPDTFAAGTSMYGISDLKKLDDFTHKFEARNTEKLMGGSSSQIPEVYKERSPINNADRIKAPLLIEQGSVDAVVPPEQAEDIVKTIKSKGGHVEYVLFEGEGHGWRKAENIKAALAKELAFYEGVFKLKA